MRLGHLKQKNKGIICVPIICIVIMISFAVSGCADKTSEQLSSGLPSGIMEPDLSTESKGPGEASAHSEEALSLEYTLHTHPKGVTDQIPDRLMYNPGALGDTFRIDDPDDIQAILAELELVQISDQQAEEIPEGGIYNIEAYDGEILLYTVRFDDYLEAFGIDSGDGETVYYRSNVQEYSGTITDLCFDLWSSHQPSWSE